MVRHSTAIPFPTLPIPKPFILGFKWIQHNFRSRKIVRFEMTLPLHSPVGISYLCTSLMNSALMYLIIATG